MGRILDELNYMTKGFAELFEEQRRHIGQGYGLSNEIILTAKKGIAALKNFEFTDVIKAQLNELWQKLGQLNLPKDQAWMFDSQAGQEYAEFLFVDLFHDFIIDGAEIGPIFSPDDYSFTPQMYLAGLGDAVGELAKIVDDYLLEDSLTKADRLAIRRRFLEVIEDVHAYLDQFETAYPLVINNSRRRGYGNTYRGLLGRVRGAIRRQKEALIATLDREAK